MHLYMLHIMKHELDIWSITKFGEIQEIVLYVSSLYSVLICVSRKNCYWFQIHRILAFGLTEIKQSVDYSLPGTAKYMAANENYNLATIRLTTSLLSKQIYSK